MENNDELPCKEPCNMTKFCMQNFCLKCTHCLSYTYRDVDWSNIRQITSVTCELNCDCKNFEYNKKDK